MQWRQQTVRDDDDDGDVLDLILVHQEHEVIHCKNQPDKIMGAAWEDGKNWKKAISFVDIWRKILYFWVDDYR